jgi:hypothetical protein
MVLLKFTSPHWDPHAKTMGYFHLADVWVSGQEVHVEGDGSVFSTTIPVVEPESGVRLTFEEDPERWARSLPTAYRSGDLLVSAIVYEHAGMPVPGALA